MSKHTPGPWISNGHGVHGKDNAWVASLRAESYQQKEIDGRLIAAAPELLEALRMQELVYFAENEIYDCRQRESMARSYEQKRAAHDKLLEAQKLLDIYQDKASEMRRNAIAKAEGK